MSQQTLPFAYLTNLIASERIVWIPQAARWTIRGVGIHPMRGNLTMSDRTTVTLFGRRKNFRSQKEAFIWLIEKWLRMKPDLFTDPKTRHVCYGPGGTSHTLHSTHAVG
jgi:hypothetical protein